MFLTSLKKNIFLKTISAGILAAPLQLTGRMDYLNTASSKKDGSFNYFSFFLFWFRNL